jgi:hypothetical protein
MLYRELVKKRFHDTDLIASWIASVSFLVPTFLSMFAGAIVDYSLHRLWIVILCGFLLLCSFYLIGFSMLTPVVSMVLFSLSLTIGPVALVSSIPLTIPRQSIGTGMGLYKTASNIGSTIMDVLIGKLQDAEGDKYGTALVALTVAAGIAVLISFLLWLADIIAFEGKLNQGLSVLNPATGSYQRLSDRAPQGCSEPASLESQNCSLSRSTETSPLLTGNGPSLVLEPFAHQADLLVPETSPSSPKSMCEDCNCFTPTPSEVPSKRTADIEDYGRKETSKNGSSSTTTCMSAPIIVSKSTLTSDSSLPCPHNCNGLQSTCFCRTFALETRHRQPTPCSIISLVLLGIGLIISWLSFFHFLDKRH